MLFAAEATSRVWHFWIAVPLFLGAVLAILSVVGLYVAKVTRTRYPKAGS
ncbi:MAG: hypothetical protein ACKOYM_03080 [Actinomycetes bacterium]